MQRTTKSGKPIISRELGTPLHTTPVNMRINNLKKQLGLIGTKVNPLTHEQRWNNIVNHVNSVTF